MKPKKMKWHPEALSKGTRVEFLTDNLGASEEDKLHCMYPNAKYGKGDVGIIAFAHPNPKLLEEGYIYVEVENKHKFPFPGEPEKLYVGVHFSQVKAI